MSDPERIAEIRRKADVMRRCVSLRSVQVFLRELGQWPETDEEWAAALDLYRQKK